MGSISFNGGLFKDGEILNADELNAMLKRMYEDQALTIDEATSLRVDNTSLDTAAEGYAAYVKKINGLPYLAFIAYDDAMSPSFEEKEYILGIVAKKSYDGVMIVAMRDANCRPCEKMLHHPTTFSACGNRIAGGYSAEFGPTEFNPKYVIKASNDPDGDFGETNTVIINKIMSKKGGFESQTSCHNYNPIPWYLNTRGLWVLPTIADIKDIKAALVDEKIKGLGGNPMALDRVSYFTCNEYDDNNVWIWNCGDDGGEPGFRAVAKNTIGATVTGTRAVLKISTL